MSALPVEVPLGVVLPYAGPITPDVRKALSAQGWLVCDGAKVSAATYPQLFALIGTVYGTPVTEGNPAVTSFYLPDYRGAFLRGVNRDAERTQPKESGKRDPDAERRLAARYEGSSGQGNRGNAVGSVQLDAFQTHEHGYQKSTQGTVMQGDKGPAKVDPDLSPATTEGVKDASGGRAASTSSETRPLNVYVNFLIKALPRVRAPNAAAAAGCGASRDS